MKVLITALKNILRNYRPQLFLGIVVVQLLVLAGMVVKRQQLLASPNSALLQCEPVDPRSLLSGDYVILRYTISDFNPREMQRLNIYKESYAYDETVYVALEPGAASGDPHRAVALSKDLAKLREKHELILRGKSQRDYQFPAENDGETRVEFDNDFDDWREGLSLRYGVEEYFVPQYEGLAIENDIAKTTVEVALAASGESAIRRLFLDGEEVLFY
ncbi:MAG: GDYXXLXY domain-containing protein [bacterium]|nr:GDYXXLXY domain-containing protein [bacterium]